jgi:hypothetical protein
MATISIFKEMSVSKDGNAWCFTLPDFECLQTSPAVFVNEDMPIKLDEIYEELTKAD